MEIPWVVHFLTEHHFDFHAIYKAILMQFYCILQLRDFLIFFYINYTTLSYLKRSVMNIL